MWGAYFCMGAYKRNVFVVIKMGAYIHGVLIILILRYTSSKGCLSTMHCMLHNTALYDAEAHH